jgi:hypothetical protein
MGPLRRVTSFGDKEIQALRRSLSLAEADHMIEAGVER